VFVVKSLLHLQAFDLREDSPSKLWLMFIITFLHQLGHSALLWYGMKSCHSAQLDGIEREVGENVEKAFFGGISYGGFELEKHDGIELWRLKEIGFRKDEMFYPIGESRFFLLGLDLR